MFKGKTMKVQGRHRILFLISFQWSVPQRYTILIAFIGYLLVPIKAMPYLDLRGVTYY